MTSSIRTLLVAIMAVLVSVPGFAQSDAEFNARGNGGSLSGDQRFINEVAQDGMAKIARNEQQAACGARLGQRSEFHRASPCTDAANAAAIAGS